MFFSWLETCCFRKRKVCLSLDAIWISRYGAFARQHGNRAPLCTQAATIRAEQCKWVEERMNISAKRFSSSSFGIPCAFCPKPCSILPRPPRATPWSRTSEQSSSPYRRRVLVDVRAVGQVDEDGVHVLHVCDGDCQVGQSGQWLVFILVLEKTRVGAGRGKRKNFYQKNRIIQQYEVSHSCSWVKNSK